MIRHEIGRGGMATVYLADDVKHNRPVALKVMRPDLSPERFLREIRIAARLQHRNIVPLHDSGQSEGYLYYVMPYIEGESLRKRLEREGQLELEEALRITRDVAAGLDYAHDQGVIHRDIKPENILLCEDYALISDFGVARAISEAGGDSITETGHAVGTPAYMSPEQAGGEQELDGRSDLYSLGCVLYEMLAGEPPFTGPTPRAVITKHMVQRPASLHVVRDSVPLSVAATVERALAKERADRLRTVSDFVSALETSVEKRRREQQRRWSRLHWAARTGLVVAATIMVLKTWQIIGGLDEGLDPNKIVVFPLVGASETAGAAEAGWDVALAIGAALEHTRPLKWIDGWSRLSEPMRQDPALITPEAARSIAEERGAHFYIDGVMRRADERVMVILRFHDVRGDSLVSQQTAVGSYDRASLPDLGLQAIAKLMPEILDPGREFDISALTDRDPGAIALWIQGEREYRLAQFGQALDFFRRAVGQDTLLVFAAIKGAQAASWNERLDEAEELIAIAVSGRSLLPDRYARFAQGLDAYLKGLADSAVASFRAALEESPGWSEAAMALGDVYYHLLPSEAPLDSLAPAFFRQAIVSDTAFTPPLMHLAEIAVREGDLGRAGSYIQRLRATGTDDWIVEQLTLMHDCVSHGHANFDWDEAAKSNTLAALQAAKALSVAGAESGCAQAGFRAVMGQADAPRAYRWGALVGLQALLVAEGRDQEALAVVRAAVESGERAAMLLYIFDVLAGARAESEAAEAERSLRQASGEYYEKGSSDLQWLLGMWHARQGDVPKVERISEGLAAKAASSGNQKDQLLSSALAAHLALLRADTAQAVSRLRSLVPNARKGSLVWRLAEPLPLEHILLAQLLLRQRDYAEAYRVASIYDHQAPVAYLALLPESLRIRLRAAEALGERRLVEQYKLRLVGLGWSGGRLRVE